MISIGDKVNCKFRVEVVDAFGPLNTNGFPSIESSPMTNFTEQWGVFEVLWVGPESFKTEKGEFTFMGEGSTWLKS